MNYNPHIWRDKFEKMTRDVLEDAPCYCKEKWGRFDINPMEGCSDAQFDELLRIEEESTKCCQNCGKHRYQIRTKHGWVEHFCIPCYIKLWIGLQYKKIKRKFTMRKLDLSKL